MSDSSLPIPPRSDKFPPRRITSRRWRNIVERHAHATQPSHITGLDLIQDHNRRTLLTVHDDPSWLFWLNAYDDVRDLMRYAARLRLERDRLKRRAR